MISFNTVIVSFQSIFYASNRNSESQGCDAIEELFEAFPIVLKLVGCKIKFFAFPFRCQELAIEALLYIGINFLCALLVASLSRRESINPEFCFPVFAYPPVELLFFILLTNSSMLIFPLKSGTCFMLKSLKALPYFFAQLYAVAGQMLALPYSLKCLLTWL